MKKQARKVYKHLLLSVSLLGLGTLMLSGCFLLPREDLSLAPPLREARPVTYGFVEAKKGTIEKRSVYMGYLVFIDPKDVFFSYQSGRLKGIYAEKGDEVIAGQLLAELDTEILEEEIVSQGLVLEKAQLIADRKRAVGSDRYELRLAEIDVEMAQHRYNILLKRLDQARLYAPISAEIVYRASMSEGEYVNPYQTVYRIADPTRLQVEYKGEMASDFRLGLEVGVSIRGEMYPGRVVQTPHDLPVDAPESEKDLVKITLDRIPDNEELGKGDYIQITLVQDRRENAIVIPKSTVNSHFNRNYVGVLVNDLRQERDVELGIETSTEVEILAGLEVGDRVILR
jgi:membrane fusion protein, macrolide-specific efflux system